MEKYILNTSDYEFSAFNHQGFGGIHKYSATPKKIGLPKLIVKHEYCHTACNEFVTSRIAELLRINTAKTYLFRINSNDMRIFKTPYAVGIEYIDDFAENIPFDRIRTDKNLLSDFLGGYAMYAMFSRFGDIPQCGYSRTNGILFFDFEEYFCLTDFHIRLLMNSESDGKTWFYQSLQSFQKYSITSDVDIIVDYLVKQLQISENIVRPILLQPMRRFVNLSKSDLQPILESISEIYPNHVAKFYNDFFAILNKKIKQELLFL